MLAIRNFGHYWSRDIVEWGERGRNNQGRLVGTERANGDGPQVDFRLQIAIYTLFDEKREVVYVGQTGDGNNRLLSRLRQHARGPLRDRWRNFSWFGFLEAGENGQLLAAQQLEVPIQGNYAGALDEIEAVLIQIVEPRLNKQGPQWGAQNARTKEFYQYSQNEPVTLEGLMQEIQRLRVPPAPGNP